MWIRSQNKEFLVDTKSVGIFHGTDGYCRIQCLDNKIYDFEYLDNKIYDFERIILGYYTTSEKANEVLDMIQEKIMHGNRLIKKDKYDLRIDAVFEMPHDDEV